MRSILIALLTLTVVPAWAAEAPSNAGECAQLVEEIEIAVEESSSDTEEADELMLALDQACADGKYNEAGTAADKLRSMMGDNG